MTMQWSEIVAKGKTMKIPTNLTRRGDKPTDVPNIIYEMEELATLMKVHRAESMLEMSLHNDCVLFEFPTMEFTPPTNSYLALTKQIGRMVGAQVITAPPHKAHSKFFVQTRFAAEEHMEQAIATGITVGDVQYRAVYTRSDKGELPNMVRVHMSGIPFDEEDIITEKLITSLSPYGKVCRLKMFRQEGIFEGKISALLDVNEDQGPLEPLQRMLYLQAWEIFIPVSYKGAPPICYHCHQSKHTKAMCPILGAVKCFQCQGYGHIARHCKVDEEQVTPPVKRTHREQRYQEMVSKETEKDEEKQENEKNTTKEDYLKKQKTEEKQTEKIATVTDKEISDTNSAGEVLIESNDMDYDIPSKDGLSPPELDEGVDAMHQSEEEDGDGLEASCHAPNTTHMHIVSRSDMLNATKIRPTTQRLSHLPTADNKRPSSKLHNLSAFTLNPRRVTPSSRTSRLQQSPSIHIFKGDPNTQQSFIKYLRSPQFQRPDILCIQEVSHNRTSDHLTTDQIEMLERLFPDSPSIYSKHCAIIVFNQRYTLLNQTITHDNRIITTSIVDTTSSAPICHIANIYAPAQPFQRASFYQQLQDHPILQAASDD